MTLQHRGNQGYSGFRPDILVHIPKTASTVLDIGCGEGVLGKVLKQRNSAVVVTGIESDSNSLEKARLNMDRVFVGDLNSEYVWKPLANDQFDVIVLADVLEHLVCPEQVLERACQLPADDGLVIVSLPNNDGSPGKAGGFRGM
ncbi:MAG: methyltransferase domain-containing protein [Chromatiales bacterium]|nr:methyltransferase domain-containing protein [Chromatiales bacterium]